MADTHTNDNTTCVVCFKNVQYFSIGECDHPVCFECSTRMRVLCLQNECPICRNVLGRVVFTDSILPYKELRNKVFTDRLFERQYKIGFCNEEIKKAYDTLLENRCSLCDNLPPFRVFSALSDHMRKVHEKYFCDLCVKHLKIFTSERRCYTRQELAHHRRKGDLDNTSHRGHPLCEFCEERFMDADELYRHLRKEHLYCHLCDADGKNLYYASHSALAHHFRTDHFLCEEGDCAGQHLTAVFRSEIDLKAHKATVHGRGMTRGAARQARTLELQFNITPHPVVTRAPRDRERERQSQLDESISPPTPAPAPRIDTGSDEHFPRLSAAPPAPGLLPGPPVKFRGAESLARTDKNFPALGLGDAGPSTRPARPAVAAATIVRNSKPSVSIQLHSQPASASNFRLTQTSSNRISVPQAKRSPLSEDDFPTLGNRDDHPSVGAGTIQPPKVTLINSQEMKAMKSNQTSSKPKKAPLSSEAFPALSTSSAPSAPPQWISVKKEKPRPKPEPAPIKTTPSFNPVADFPTLPNNKKNKKTPTPIPTSAPNRLSSGSTVNRSTTATKLNTPPDLKLSKKEKKKQFNLNLDNDSKKENIEVPQVNGLNDKRILQEMSYGESSINAAAPVAGRKIKTIDTIVKPEKERNGGNGDFALASKDFPTLSKGVPLSNKAPKDYSQISKGAVASKTKKAPNGAPPGFKPRPECNGMTFTNSSGQTFSAPVHTYIQPPDFEQRNRALVKKFVDALGSAEAVEEFKVASRAFRDNMIGADDFYKHCNEAMGSKLDDVFPDLVALLPDIAKQQELVVGRDVSLVVCATCGQLLAQSDRLQHESAHWPPLVPH